MTKIAIPYIKNLSCKSVSFADPASRPSPDRKGSKDQFKHWRASQDTDDMFISMFAGNIRNLRVDSTNAPAVMYGVCCDYDMPLNAEERMRKLNKLGTKPTYIAETFSGGVRAVWMFENPIPLLPDTGSTEELLKIICKELGLKNAFGPLDNSYYRASQYYHRGWNWQEAGGESIPMEQVLLWQSASWKKAVWKEDEDLIPLEYVAEEAEKRFPGRWTGEFVEGARGIRFWDPIADNPTGAVITKGGVMAYSGEQRFLRWSEIFGKDFVKTHRRETEGQAINDTFCISNDFYVQNTQVSEDGTQIKEWCRYNRANMESLLQARYGLNHIATNKAELSQVKRVIGEIINLKTLSGVMPVIYDNRTVVEMFNRSYLNISTVRALQPDEEKGKTWGDGFPWLASFMERFFAAKDNQLDYVLSWLARAYQGALNCKPTRGQAVYIAGAAGTGKTFLTDCIIAPLFGGKSDATDYLTGRTSFNGKLCRTGIWCIDDATPLSDTKAHAYYSAMIKKMVANGAFMYQPKYVETEDIPWLGRLIILCNTDPESLRILPAVDINNADKLMFFRSTDEPLVDEDASDKAVEELPAFAAYLARYEIPEECKGTPRFGVRGYLHPDLYMEAVNSGAGGVFKEIFINFLNNYFGSKHDSDITELRGTSQYILQTMKLDVATEKVLKDMTTARNIGTYLGKLAHGDDGFPITSKRSNTKREWRVDREEFFQYLKDMS